MKERELFEKTIGEKLLNPDHIRDRAIATAQARLLVRNWKTGVSKRQSSATSTSVALPAVSGKSAPRSWVRRSILLANLALVALVLGLAAGYVVTVLRPAWLPEWLGGGVTEPTIATTTTTDPPVTITPAPIDVQAMVDGTAPFSTQGGLRLYHSLVLWDKYNYPGKISEAMVTPTWSVNGSFHIDLVDQGENLFVSCPGDAKTYPGSKSSLGIYRLASGEYQLFAEAADERPLAYLAENEKYIVWQEGSRPTETSMSVLHVRIRESGEDIAFAMPNVDSGDRVTGSLPPPSPVLILDDAVYFDAVVRISEEDMRHIDLYRFDIANRTMERLAADASDPFLYQGGLSWLDRDDTLEIATPVNKDGLIDGLPAAPFRYVDAADHDQTVFNSYGALLADPENDNGLLLVENSASTLILSSENKQVPIGNPQTNGQYIAFDTSIPMIFDLTNGVMVDLSARMGNASLIGFFHDRLYFLASGGNSAGEPRTVYWIELGYNKAESAAKLESLRYYRDVIPWGEYTSAQIHETALNLQYDTTADSYKIEMSDGNRNLFITTRKKDDRGHQFPVKGPILGIVDPEDGLFKPLAQCAVDRNAADFLAVNDAYIVWREYRQTLDAGDTIMHITVRKTGEDLAFTLPTTDYGNSQTPSGFSKTPGYPGLLVGDAYYFHFDRAVVHTAGVFGSYLDLYRYDIPTRTLERVSSDAGFPFLYFGKPAWLRIDGIGEEGLATPVNADGIIRELPVLPLNQVYYTCIVDDVLLTAKPVPDDAAAYDYNDWCDNRYSDWDNLYVTYKGTLDRIVGSKAVGSCTIDRPVSDGKRIVFGTNNSGKHPMLYDLERSMLVELDELPYTTRLLGFYGDRIVFVGPTDTTIPDSYNTTIYWIDMNELD